MSLLRKSYIFPDQIRNKGVAPMKPTILIIAAVAAGGAMAGTEDRTPGLPISERQTAATGKIVGFEEGVFHGPPPPALVLLNGVSRGATVWVEVFRGPSLVEGTGTTVESRYVLRGRDEAILDIGDLVNVCRREGTWTVAVMIRDGREPRVLAQSTFDLGGAVPSGGGGPRLVRAKKDDPRP